MHTADELRSADFRIVVDGNPAQFVDLLPGFGQVDRLGVVVRRPCGGLGASILTLAAVTAFYDIQRARSAEFFIYPDYFLFHVGRLLGDHGMLDIWPGHKEVVVPDDPEEILRAINDRAITRLVVEDVEPGEASFERESLASARSRIASCLAYAPGGDARDADVTLTGNAVTESYVSAVLEQSAGIETAVRERIRSERAALVEDGIPVEGYRRITLDEALAMLARQPALVA